MSRLSNNLRHLRKQKGFTQEEMAEKLGLTRSILGSYEEGRAEPKLQTLQTIANFFSISIDDLIGKEPNDLMAGSDVTGNALRVLPIVVNESNRELVSIVPLKAAAGYLNGYSDTEFIRELSSFSLPLSEISQDRTYRIFQTKGDSMLPIPSGSYIIASYVDDWTQIKTNQCYVVLTKDDGIIYKRISATNISQNELMLSSDNPAYPAYSIPLDTVLEVWKAVGYISFQLPEFNELSLEKLSSLVLEMQKDLNKMRKDNG
jgi:transcriptional regulator with XRE-family HTH domain